MLWLVIALSLWWGASVAWILGLRTEVKAAKKQADIWRGGYYELLRMRVEFYANVAEQLRASKSNESRWN